MSKLIVVSSLTLFWAFYEMSGGADFEPKQREVVSAAPWDNVAPTEPATNQVAQIASAAPETIEVSRLQTVGFQVPTTEPATAQTMVYAAAVVTEVEATPPADLRLVVGSRVNIRQGPGTNHAVIDTVSRGTQAEVIAINDAGWAQIRLSDSGKTGWMAERLLSDS